MKKKTVKKKVAKVKARKAAKAPAKKASAKRSAKKITKKAMPKREKLQVVNVKLSKAVREALIAKAKRHTKGNLSLWFRHAGLKYVPAKNEVIAEL